MRPHAQLTREAEVDLAEAFDYYEAQLSGLGHEFVAAVEQQLKRIEFEMMQSFFRMVQPVEYSDTYPICRTTDPRVQQVNLLTKSKMWQHEAEWRVIDIQQGPGYRQFSSKLLTGVILGARISPQNESLVRGWSAESPADPKLHRALVRPREYGLDIVADMVLRAKRFLSTPLASGFLLRLPRGRRRSGPCGHVVRRPHHHAAVMPTPSPGGR